MTVVRHLDVGKKVAPKVSRPRVLFVVGREPGFLRDLYDFDGESALVRGHLDVSDRHWKNGGARLSEALSEAARSFRPDIVHLAGLDTHTTYNLLLQAARCKKRETSPMPWTYDGAARKWPTGTSSRGAGTTFIPCQPTSSAQRSNPRGHSPRLVAFNLWNSAARLAPLTVAAGAGAAIGFQDVFDDDLAEIFYSCLYSDWRRADWDLPFAFRSAWESVRSRCGATTGNGCRTVERVLAVSQARPESLRAWPIADTTS